MLRKSTAAKQDLENIWLYIAHENLKAADDMIDRIDEAFYLLEENPLAGRAYQNPKIENLRIFPVRKYLILYYPIQGGVYVNRILHGAMNFGEFFQE